MQDDFTEPDGVHMHFLQSSKSSMRDQEWRPLSMKSSIFQCSAVLAREACVGLARRWLSCSHSSPDSEVLVRSPRVRGVWVGRGGTCFWWNQGDDRLGMASAEKEGERGGG